MSRSTIATTRVRRAELADEVVRLARLAAGRTVLDLACGSGYWTEVMSRTAVSIVASDLAPEMLTEAKKKAFGCEISFVEADLFGHDYGDQGFDLVALGFWFSHHPRQDYDRLFEALLRPLTPNGLIWMVDNNPPAEGSLHPTVGSDRDGNHLQRRVLPDGGEFVILKNYFTRADLEEIFRWRFEIRLLIHNPYYWSVVLCRPAN